MISIFFSLESANAQTTFNLRTNYGFPAAVLTSIIPTDSCYYTTGLIADSIFPHKAGNIFLKLDLGGNPVYAKTLTDSIKTFETWWHTLTVLPNGDFVNAGYSYTDHFNALFIKYDQFGDTLFTKEFQNPGYPQFDFMQARAFTLTPDGGYLFACPMQVAQVGVFQNSDIIVIKTDQEANTIWTKKLGETLWDLPICVGIDEEKNYLIGGGKRNNNLVDENYTYQTYIISLDSLGNENWSYLSPISDGLRDGANDMVLLDDGSLVVASGIGYEQDRASVNDVFFDKYVFKLSPDHQIEWELTFPDVLLTGKAFTTNVEQVSDGSGFVFAGVSSTYIPAPAEGAHTGWISKVSNIGTLMWERKYYYLTDTPSDNKIYDLKETPDGGFILCGEARDIGSGAVYPQQAWLLKLDSYGCLVPGCHLLDSTEEGVVSAMSLAIYPNPTTDYLNFQVRGKGGISKSATFLISNMEGKVVQQVGGIRGNTTYIIPVWEWPAGIYILQYLEDGLVKATEKFVVTK